VSALDRVARALDLGGPAITWTVRRPHGVHLVEMRRSPFGDRVLVDGREAGRSDPWRFGQTVRVGVGDTRAELRIVADTEAGTLRNELWVDDAMVPPDARRAPPAVVSRWRPLLERAAYVLAAALALAGLIGDPVFTFVRQIVWTLGALVLFMGLRAIDPFAVITIAFDKIVEDRLSMMIAGAEIAALATIVADRFGLRRRLPFVRERRLLPRVLGWIAIAAIAFAVLELS
jgi:hypothetical protein